MIDGLGLNVDEAAYHSGYRAFRSKKKLEQNPFKTDDGRHQDWRLGWFSASHERRIAKHDKRNKQNPNQYDGN